MPKVAVITDTDASLPPELAERYGIRQVPITVQFGEEAFAAGVDLDDAATFARVDREGRLPKTAAPAPARFAEAFEAALAEGAQSILCFCVSSGISATYNSALLARDLLPGRDIQVIDSQTVSMAIGFQAMAAVEAAQAGASPEAALAAAASVAARTSFYATVTTLKYLVMGGRVSHLAAGMAGLLDVKPILTMRSGKLEMLERVRSRARAQERLVDLTAAALAGRPLQQLALLHVVAAGDARQLHAKLAAGRPCPEPVLAELTPGLSVHGGPGMVGIVAVAQ